MSTKLSEIAWIAGLLEGEGNFIFHKTPTIQLNMVDLDTIEKVRKIISPNNKINIIARENLQIQYKLHICGSIAIQWMMTIYSLMSIRRQAKIREVIQRWKEMPGRTESSKRNLNKEHTIRAVMRMKDMSREEAANWLNDQLKRIH